MTSNDSNDSSDSHGSTRSTVSASEQDKPELLLRLIEQENRWIADRGHLLGFRVYAGHGLTTGNVGPVGDAGYTKDPISAHGISDALRDAELCARAVDRAICRPDETAEAMNGYQRLRDGLSQPMFRESQVLARYQWDAAEASDRMRAISEAVRAECAVLASQCEWTADLATV